MLSFLRARPDCGSPYHESKWAAEQLIRESGLDYTILKAGMIYGRGDHLIDQPPPHRAHPASVRDRRAPARSPSGQARSTNSPTSSLPRSTPRPVTVRSSPPGVLLGEGREASAPIWHTRICHGARRARLASQTQRRPTRRVTSRKRFGFENGSHPGVPRSESLPVDRPGHWVSHCVATCVASCIEEVESHCMVSHRKRELARLSHHGRHLWFNWLHERSSCRSDTDTDPGDDDPPVGARLRAVATHPRPIAGH